MKIIKRSGIEVEFDRSKIAEAIKKANNTMTNEIDKISNDTIEMIVSYIESYCINKLNHTPTVEEIQDMVENQLMTWDHNHNVAREYITYRFTHNVQRQTNTTDKKIMSLVEYENEEVKQENSNKNPQILSVQRDYMAGEVSRDMTARFLLPEDIVKAHEEGLIHFHQHGGYVERSM